MKPDYIDTISAEGPDGSRLGTIEAYLTENSQKPWFLVSEVLVFLGFKPKDHIFACNTLHENRHRYSLCKIELPDSDGSSDSVYAVDSKLAREMASAVSRFLVKYHDPAAREAYLKRLESLVFLMDEAELFFKAHQKAKKERSLKKKP